MIVAVAGCPNLLVEEPTSHLDYYVHWGWFSRSAFAAMNLVQRVFNNSEHDDHPPFNLGGRLGLTAMSLYEDAPL